MGNKTSEIKPSRFGLIGRRLDYSFSKSYFEEKFTHLQLPHYSYTNIVCKDDAELAEFFSKKIHQYKGVNVTIPYKEKVIPFLDQLDRSAKKVGAVNTIVVKKGVLTGYNTDVYGFQTALIPFMSKPIPKALIFGTGGAAKAVKYALEEMHISLQQVSRNPTKTALSYVDLDAKLLESHLLLVNCTPVGTYPNLREMLPIPMQYISKKHLVFDLIYNPEESLLLKKARDKGATTINGLTMLQNQADKAWEIWNNV